MESIVISACLLGKNCKYNGKNNYNKEVEALKAKYKVIPICPESFGRLPIPREPSEINGNKVFSKSGKDVTTEFLNGANKTLGIAKKNNCKYAVLKQRSPSCGSGEIYDGTFSSKVIPGNGITAALLKENGITVLSEENFQKYL